MFLAKCLQDEKPFFVIGAENVEDHLEGDGDISEGNILEARSNAFSYWSYKSGKGFDILDTSPNTPIVSVPMLDSGNHAFGEGYYHSETLGGQAVVLTTDGSAVIYSLETDGKIVDHSIHGGTGKHIENKGHDFTDTMVTHPLGVLSK